MVESSGINSGMTNRRNEIFEYLIKHMKPRIIHICILSLLISAVACFAAEQGRQVHFVTEDSVTIAGSYYDSDSLSASAPALILLHMLGKDRSTWQDFAVRASKAGFAVLSIDLRGHGESTVSASGPVHFSDFEEVDYNNMQLDVLAAVKWLRAQTDDSPLSIAIIGASIGANVALNYGVTDPEITALILLSPGENYRGVETKPAALTVGDRPVLFIASDDDNYAAVSTRTLYDSCKDTKFKQLEIYDHGGHGTYLFETQRDLMITMLKFLNTHLDQKK